MKILHAWLLTGLLALAADVTGSWSGSMPGRDGQTRNVTFQFQQAGEKLNGSMRGPTGREWALSNGTVNGDEVRFQVSVSFGERNIVQSYAGSVRGDEMQLKMMREGGRATELLLKREK